MTDDVLGYVVVLGTFVALTWAAWFARTKAIDDFYVAGRRVKPIWSGMAAGADWMSAASFLSMAGAISVLGYGGLAYVMGWTGGYVLLALVVAPCLRRFGKYTTADFVGERYESQPARAVALACAVIVSFTYCIAQVAGCGIIMGRLLGLPFELALVAGVLLVVASTLMGGIRSVVWTQCAQYLIVVFGFLLPVTVLCLSWYGHPFPQLAYGDLLAKIVVRERALGISPTHLETFSHFSKADTWVLTLVLMLGTAGLPQVTTRFLTTPSPGDARRSAAWALVFIAVLYLTAPAYAAFQKYVTLTQVVGQPIAKLPAWVVAWGKVGLCTVTDRNGDGLLQLGELHLHRDALVLALPELAGLPYVVWALVAAGGLAASISSADGLLTAMAAAFSHDFYFRMVNPKASEYRRLYLGVGLVVLSAGLAGYLAARQLGFIVEIVAWAFSLAAATFFPALVMGLFSPRTNKHGAVVGMAGGLAVTLLYIGGVRFGWPVRIPPVAGIHDQGAGLFGMVFNFLSCVIVSRLTPPPSAQMRARIAGLRLFGPS